MRTLRLSQSTQVPEYVVVWFRVTAQDHEEARQLVAHLEQEPQMKTTPTPADLAWRRPKPTPRPVNQWRAAAALVGWDGDDRR